MASVYRPPKKTPVEEVQQYSEDIIRLIRYVMERFSWDSFLIGGDFNLPDICWETLKVTGSQYTQKLNNMWLNFAMDRRLRLEQWVQFPTRNNNTLDLFFTNRPHIKPECKPIRPGVADHDAVLIVQPIDKPPIMRIVNNNMDREIKMEKIANSFINNLNMNSRVGRIWGAFYSQMKPLVRKYVNDSMSQLPPHSQFSRHGPPNWMNEVSVRREAIKKNKFYKLGYEQNDESYKEQYHSAKAAYQSARVSAFTKFIEGLFQTEISKRDGATAADVIHKIIENMELRYDPRHDYFIVQFLKAHSGAVSSMIEVMCCACEQQATLPGAWEDMYDKNVIRTGRPQEKISYVFAAFRCMIANIVQAAC